MEINCLKLGMMKTNCYMILTEKSAIVIDPGVNSSTVEDFLNQHKEKERIILLTHGHFDHIGGALELHRLTGVNIAIGALEEEFLCNNELNLSNHFRPILEPFNADIRLSDGQILNVGDLEIKVIATPGHSKGSVVCLLGNILFSGDTLFLETVGRTDLPTSSFEDLKKSVKKLYQLDDDVTVYPGHGDSTSIAHEKKYNNCIRE